MNTHIEIVATAQHCILARANQQQVVPQNAIEHIQGILTRTDRTATCEGRAAH
jgi:hypothetical protein